MINKLFVLFTFCTSNSFAQNIELGLSTTLLNTNKDFGNVASKYNTRDYKSYFKVNTSILFSINKKVKENYYGIEFAKYKNSSSLIRATNYIPDNVTLFDSSCLRSNNILLNFISFRKFQYLKFHFYTGLMFSTAFNYNKNLFKNEKYENNTSKIVIQEVTQNNQLSNTFNLGLNSFFGVSKLIFKNIYFNSQLVIGINNETLYRNELSTIEIKTNNLVVENYTVSIDRKKNSTISLDIYPKFSLIYILENKK